MRPDHPSPSDQGTSPRPRPDIAASPAPSAPRDADWDEILLTAFGPRHWNLGCG